MENEKLIDEIASAIVADVFHNRHLQAPATRLVLVREDDVGDMKQNLGGMCKDALHRTVSDRLANALAATERDSFKPTHRHFKGRLYQVLMRGIDTETNAESVIYRDGEGRVFVRPASSFDDKTIPSIIGRSILEPRFAALSPAKPTEDVK